MVRNKDDGPDRPAPVKKEDAVMRRLYSLNCCRYF